MTRQFFVVDNDSGENWPIETIGDETIRTAQGYLETRHFKRLPRHDGDLRRIDVWLAPSLGWLPARIMQTEPNGTQVELVWRGKLNADESGAAASGSNDTSVTNGAGGAGSGDAISSGSAANQPSTTNVPATTPEAAPASSVNSTAPGSLPEKP